MLFGPPIPVAWWSSARGAWITGAESLFCRHSSVSSLTSARWGSMRNGAVYPLAAPGHLIAGNVFSSSLFPTPTARDWKGVPGDNVQMSSLPREILRLPEHGWGKYAGAVAGWEPVAGREPPAPVVLSPRGNRRLAPVFVEWVMGLPEGWVTRVPVLTYRDQLTLLGNGVVFQQGAVALRELLARRQPI